MKQETTLEEAAEKYVEDFDLSFYDTVEEIPVKELGKKDFKEGAKWQSERMYSEEDMQEYAEFCIRCDREGLPCIVVKDWFEQFKK